MNRFDGFTRWAWSVFVAGALSFALAGCDGSDGATGPQGPQGPEGPPGQDGLPGAGVDPNDPATLIALSKTEACGTCHSGIGTEHQAVYESYINDSALAMTIDNVTSAPDGAGTFTVTTEFSITENGVPFDAGANLGTMDQRSFYAVQYNSVTGQYLESKTLFSASSSNPVGNIVSNGDGTYVLTTTGISYAPESPAAPYDGAQVYGYIARGSLFEHIGGTGAEIPAGGHVHLYEDVSNAAYPVGTAAVADASSYESAANVEGCQKCHGTPYLKHGYRAGKIDGIPDFAGCKSCHYDNRTGGHEDWQWMVDEPLEWATNVKDAAVKAKYAYTANIMNDVHMSHAMEFPYPQSMQNCATCHEGKLDTILADENFTAATCLSCHPATGTDAWPKSFDANGNVILDSRNNPVPQKYGQPNRPPPLSYLWYVADIEQPFHTPDSNCNVCHKAAVDGGFAVTFRELHTGYDVNITNAAGQRYADLYSVSVDDITVSGNLLTIDFSATEPKIVPEVLVSFYGWDSKQYIIASHSRDNAGNRLEFAPGDNNPLFTEDPASVPGAWSVTLDMAAYAPIANLPEDIPTLIANGTIKRVEVSITPELNLADVGGEDLDVVLTAANKTFDFLLNQVRSDYFKGVNAVVSTAKCNVCHDALASSFHSETGRGGDGIEVCKNCHVTTSPGSHLEMASRAIDNYVHAIHTFQAFDPGDDFKVFDPVKAKRYDMHTKHVFPNFTIRNCEACHVKMGDKVNPLDPNSAKYPAVVYNVPDQTKSMPGVASASDNVITWYDIATNGLAQENPLGRNIGTVPEYVMGPASRACGGCHRARLIRDDAAGELASFNAHTEAGGTLVENDGDDVVVYGVIRKIMEMFE